MAKIASEMPLDVNQLPETDSVPQMEQTPSRQLPEHLADFQQYTKSKLCYYSKPVENAEIINIQPKVAFRCQMTILMETRELRMKVTPYPWKTETVLGSTMLGKFKFTYSILSKFFEKRIIKQHRFYSDKNTRHCKIVFVCY
jgi:hypothetical protein